jgi:mannose-6-phosphate isomerase-like protein (cupin superfamily)
MRLESNARNDKIPFMKFLLLLATASLLSAQSPDFVVWKAADLRNFETKLHSKLNQHHTALERLPDYEGHSAYVVHREGTGVAETHKTMSHMIYVISGEAVVVVGGTIVGPRKADDETTLGDALDGGKAMEVAAGDLVHIPYGAPHIFRLAPGTQVTYVMLNLESGKR